MKKTITLRNQDGTILHKADHASTRDALEYCIEHNIPLDGLYLTHENLEAANLDGWKISYARLIGCNFRHTNLSEAVLRNCDFSGSDMTDICLCYSDLFRCTFLDTNLEKADFSQAIVISPTFSIGAARTINFGTLHQLHSPNYHPGHNDTIHASIETLHFLINKIFLKFQNIL